jgi:hypothetical protein
MKSIVFTTLMLLVAPRLAHAQPDCSIYNTSTTSIVATATDNQQHGTSYPNYHEGSAAFVGDCQYTGAPASGACSILCQANYSQEDVADYGTSHPYSHFGSFGYTNGQATSTGPPATCGSQVEVAVKSCLTNIFCSVDNVTISGSVYGIGGSVSFSSAPLWPHNFPYSHTCAAKTAPSCNNPWDLQPSSNEGADGAWEWSIALCEWVWVHFGNTPIIIDTDGSGFHLTSEAGGVMFDFYGTGQPIRIAWTDQGSTNGWLALDRNGNGKIDSAKELFGNITAQPTSKDPNGFLALAVFDSNADGAINDEDTIWLKLKVWIDTNHDGISQPNELHSLDDVGIRQINLKYTDIPLVDQYGNKFRYKGSLKPLKDDEVDRVIYDVILR